MTADEALMNAALAQARMALDEGEIPVGAVIAQNGEVIAAAHNTRESSRSALNHAELLAVEAACAALGDWRLTGCELFVTLEPCAMCAGAALNARLSRVVYGAREPRTGCAGSLINLFALPYEHTVLTKSGVLAEECERLLAEFFKRAREG